MEEYCDPVSIMITFLRKVGETHHFSVHLGRFRLFDLLLRLVTKLVLFYRLFDARVPGRLIEWTSSDTRSSRQELLATILDKRYRLALSRLKSHRRT